MIAMALVVGVSAVAQEHTMSISESPVEDATDLDARAYFPRRDVNDEVCALLKVTPTNPMKNKLILEVGGLGVVDRVEQENGEIWFYLPARVKNLRFSCAGYTTPPAIPVNFKSGYVYRLTIYTDAIVQSVQNAVLSATFLKIIVNVEGAVVSLGRTAEYEMVSKNLDGKIFTQRLNFGTYHYKVEHPLYETAAGTIEVKAGLADQHINLKPAYGYLNITSSPSGASLYVDGKKVGTTPWSGEERFGRGRVEVKIQTDNYYPLRQEIAIVGKGEAEKFHFDLRPQFGTVECVCDDAEAELWIDEEYKGKGRWMGPIGSLSQHILEARRAGHQSQSVVIAVKEGESATCRVGAPVALYGMLEVQTTPELCEIKVDGVPMGTTPTILSLLVGKHKVELSADGYQTDVFDVEIAHNQTSALSRELKEAKAVAKTYKVGDLYDDGIKKGVVFEVSADGKSGKIVSLEESQQQWATSDVYKNATGATWGTDGAMNMRKIQSIGGWQEKYPAFAWCASLGDGWYLPAKSELQDISRAKTKIDATLEKQGLEITNNWYWSSTEYSTKEFCAWRVHMDDDDGYTTYNNKNFYNYVRAVSAFGSATIADKPAPASAPAVAKTYKVGDLYDDGIKKGVVFEVTADGEHGKIVSLEESKQLWATDGVWKNATGATSETDGAMNMRKIQSVGGWQEKYPAFAWCASLGEGWYLPAKSELLAIYKAKTKIDATLEKQGLEITHNCHWSSTEYSVYEFCAWYVNVYDGYTSYDYKNDCDYVRAVSAF